MFISIQIVSFDVSSLYTNVPVIEAIHLAAERLYQLEDGKPEVEKEGFIELAKLACSNVIMSTPNGYHKQIDGLAMGSQPALRLANLWLSQFEDDIKDEAEIFTRYVDDILLDIRKDDAEERLLKINNLHQNLKFTI